MSPWKPPETYPVLLRMQNGQELDFDIDANEIAPILSKGYPSFVALSPLEITEIVGSLMMQYGVSTSTVRGFAPSRDGGRLRCVVRCEHVSAVLERQPEPDLALNNIIALKMQVVEAELAVKTAQLAKYSEAQG